MSKWPNALNSLDSLRTFPMSNGTLFQLPLEIACPGGTGSTGVPAVAPLITTCCSAATRLGVQAWVAMAYGSTPRRQLTTVDGSVHPSAATNCAARASAVVTVGVVLL